MSTTRRFLAALTGATLMIAGVAVTPAHANPAGTDLVISEVFGAGGNNGALVNADFVELYNPTDAPIDLNGLSIHYRALAGASGGAPYALAGEVPAHGSWLIQMGAVGANGAALPTPDSVASPAFSMAGPGGQVYLLHGTTEITTNGNTVGNPLVVDMVGLNNSTSFEAASGPTTTGDLSANRDAAGADTDNNSVDFTLAAPTPTNSGTTGGGGTTDATIAEIQGADTQVSPFLGESVRTEGVVTAVYATGGLNGFYCQTAGTGAGVDATPTASDGIFVFGSAAVAAAPEIGDLVEVTADVAEFAGETELTPTTGGVVILEEAHAPVTALVAAYPSSETDREAHEGELLAPVDDFVVTDNYATNQYGEIGLATGGEQLRQPTDVADAQDNAAIAAVVADNAARGVVLDDATSINYLSAANQGTPMPWLTPTNPVRIGAGATLHQPVILTYRNSAWKFLPTQPVTDDGSAVVTFGDTRTANEAPAPVGGDLTLGTFNVLNYFNTTGEDWVTSGRGTCTYYNDRTGSPVSDNTCSNNGPRGAAQSSDGTDLTAPTADLERQQAKIVRAINTLDADILSLEEIENSVALGEADRDDALASLVDVLNADAGTARWAYAPSPAAADLPDLAEQDVIRTAFIYNPATVDLVGDSVVLTGEPAFADAREPLAQGFKRAGALPSDAFVVIVNHFKSKGSGDDDGTGQGLANPDRVAQAQALLAFADAMATANDTTKVFLTGDFNAYTEEDPVQVLETGGFTNLVSDDPGDTSYQFDGMAGSLDHVFANADASDMVAGVDVWQVNAEESVAFEYSRYNYNATLLYDDDQFRASDHNPALVGLDAPYATEATTTQATVTPDTVGVDTGTVTIDATVTGDSATPTGTVEYWVGATKLGESALDESGATSFEAGPFADVGTTTIQVRYLGDPTHDPSSTSLDVTVVQGQATISASADPSTIEVLTGTTTVSVTVESDGPAPTGDVEYSVDGDVIATSALAGDGTTEAELGPFPEAGVVTVDVDYLGDANTGGAATSTQITVEPVASTTALSLAPAKVVVGSGTTTATATVTSSAAVAGSVEFLVDGDVVATEAVSGGTATAELGPFAAAGSVAVEARFTGSTTVAESSDTETLQVAKATPTMTLSTKPAKVHVKKTKVKVAVALASAGVRVSGTVTVQADGRTYQANVNGKGKVTITLKPFRSTGRERITVTYGGDALNTKVTKKTTITVVR